MMGHAMVSIRVGVEALTVVVLCALSVLGPVALTIAWLN